MKKLMFAIAVAAALSASAELKIGTVEMMTLVRNHSSYEPNRTLVAETEKDYTKKIDALKKNLEEIQSEGRKLAEQSRNPMLASGQKAKLEKELVDIQERFLSGQQRLRSEAMRSQQELQELEAKLLKIATEDLRKRITAYAEENGYDMILDSSAAPFAKNEMNVTDGILRAMGVDPEKAKSAKDMKVKESKEK